ncbi:hypothetical protein RHSIM_Rhsim07G0220500 [Rhododendron simsii]|uniref:PORR domain-containing protein n=1 Tax=Rhododendron simsii TaxID=118357 RepID=A0A834GKR1_RHOSS|nr:hypothetical protein RHSIM_Rhsim07G0220500 [Rhododendron simsii]
MFRWLSGSAEAYGFLYGYSRGFDYQQKLNLVDVKFKWVKDKVLDAVIVGERDVRAVCTLVSIISSNPQCLVPVYLLSRRPGQLGLPDSGGTLVPCFRLTPEALNLH